MRRVIAQIVALCIFTLLIGTLSYRWGWRRGNRAGITARLSTLGVGQKWEGGARDIASAAPAVARNADWQKAFANIARVAEPAVVHIRVVKRIPLDPFEEFFYEFFSERPPVQEGYGSGFFFRDDGYILTNFHVIEGAQRLRIGLYDKTELDAKPIGWDPWLDLAVLKVELPRGKKIHVLRLGDSDKVEVGDWAIAIGNPFGLGQTITVGFINAKEREFETVEGKRSVHSYLQTSALINPGNSGGPLLNVRGEVIGINTFIYNPTGQKFGIGIGFAIPINTVKVVLSRLLKGGLLEHGFLGVVVEDANRPEVAQLGINPREGALIVRVHPNTPAANSGLQAGDIVIRFNGKPIRTGIELIRQIWLTPPNTDVRLEIVRGDRVLKLTARLGRARI